MRNIKLEVSARHVHLSQEHVDILFGEGYQLTPKKDLSQPGQFACEERVTVVGPKKTFENVAVLGPVRPESQIEFAKSDCFALGIMGAIRESGDIEGTPGVELKTEKGSVMLNKGLIIAKRHIHMTPEDAAAYYVTLDKTQLAEGEYQLTAEGAAIVGEMTKQAILKMPSKKLRKTLKKK